MANRTNLKTYFNTGDRPTQGQFTELIDSSLNIEDDKATEAEAQDQSIDNKYLTPKTAKKSVEKFAPVKTVNSKVPNATTGDVALTVADIPALQTTLSGKQATLVSGTTLKTVKSLSLLGAGDIEISRVFKSTAANGNINTGRTDVTGLNNISVAAGKRYYIELIADYQTPSLTVGGSIGLILTSGTVGSIKGVIEMQASATDSQKKLINAVNTSAATAGSFITSTAVGAINAPHFITANLYFECSAAGNIKVQWGTSTQGTQATLNAGAIIVITTLN